MKQHHNSRISVAVALLGAGLFSSQSAALAQTGCVAGKWTLVPGPGTTTGTGPAAVVLNYDLHLFVTGAGDRIYTNIFAGAERRWTGWGEVPGDGIAMGGTGPAAAIHGGSLYLFVIGLDNRIAVNTRTASNWTGWIEVPGGGLSTHAPAATSFRGFKVGQQPELGLFIRATDGTIQVNKLIGTAWTGWREVPGGGITTHGPAAIGFSPGPLVLSVRGLDGAVAKNVLDTSTGNWSGWLSLGGFVTAAPSAVATHDFVMLARGMGGKIYHRNYNTGWKLFPNNLSGTSTAGPSGVFYGSAVQVFISGLGDRVYCTAK